MRHGQARIETGPVPRLDGIPPFATHPIDVRVVASHLGPAGGQPLVEPTPVERVVQITAPPSGAPARRVVTLAVADGGSPIATEVAAAQGGTVVYKQTAETHGVDRLLGARDTVLKILADVGAADG